MSVGMRDSDGGGGARAYPEPSPSFSYSELGASSSEDSKRRNRRSQLQKNEGEDIKPTDGEKIYACLVPDCLRIFTSKFKLMRHNLIHSEERKFQCDYCTRRFHRKDHLKNHLQVHNPNKILYSCDFCQKTYSSVLSYRKHTAFHAAEAGDLVCKLCGKILPDQPGILQHLKVHNGSRTLRGPSERKFPCERCDRSFFTKKDVKRHLVVHTGKREFACQYCPQRFGRKDHLVRHTKKSHTLTNGNNNPSPESVHSQPPLHNGTIKTEVIVASSPLPDISRLEITPPLVPPVLESAISETSRHETYITAPPNIVSHSAMVQPSFTMAHLHPENGQNISSRFSESAILPMPQYMSMNPTYTSVNPIMPHHYINVPPSNAMMSELLPPLTPSQPFPGVTALDIANAGLPHFNQAFQ